MELNEVPIDIENREFTEDDLMSNFDGNINRNVENELIKNPNKVSGYPGWKFYGICWYENDKFYYLVKRYCSRVSIFESETTEGLMQEVCNVYGYD